MQHNTALMLHCTVYCCELMTTVVRVCVQEGAVISESSELLAALKDGLIDAEMARRKGDIESVYMACVMPEPYRLV